MRREAFFKGKFYPDSYEVLDEFFQECNEIVDESLEGFEILDKDPNLIVVPHAGYIYSGFSANIAYRAVKDRKRAIVIGPSHSVRFNEVSAGYYDSIETPFGDLEVDLPYLNYLKESFELNFYEQVFKEHSTETQMPFLKYYSPDIKVIELVYGDIDEIELKELIGFLLKDEDNLVVVSTDLSHFYDLETANRIDNLFLVGLQNLDIATIDKSEACGMMGVKATIEVAREIDLKPTILDYRTSADVSEDKSKVVGYASAIFTKE